MTTSLPSKLPLTRDIQPVIQLSLLIALLLLMASLCGLFFPEQIYPTEATRQSFTTNDVINLGLGLPLLLLALWLTRRGSLVGLLFWPGMLFYVIYNALAYLFGLPFNLGFLFALALIASSGYALIILLSSIDAPAVQARLQGKVPVRLTAGILVLFGLLFCGMAIGELIPLLQGQAELDPALATRIADLLTVPAWVVGGVLLWLRKPFGFVSGAGLLFQGMMLFIGLLVFFALQPSLAGVPFPMEDFVVVAGMSLIILVPFGLFLRGVRKA